MKSIYAISALLAINFASAQMPNETYQGQLLSPIPENFFSGSPDVMAFQKINLLPVNLYTGKIELDIPLYEIKSGDISVPISISYNSGGIKVDDFASSVGIGWSLNAGGSIIRIVKDLPDNEVSYSLFKEYDWDLQYILKPALSAYGYNRKGSGVVANHMEWGENRHAIYIENMQFNPISGFENDGWEAPVKDLSPDLFRANAPGLNTEFVTINNSAVDIVGATFSTTFLDNNGSKMESVIADVRASNGIGFPTDQSENHFGRAFAKIRDFFEFNITNNRGVKYKFDEAEVSESFWVPFGGSGDGYGYWNVLSTMTSNNYSKRIHTWNLKSISDAKSNRTVSYEYTTYASSSRIVNTVINGIVTTGAPTIPSVPEANRCTFNYSKFGSNLNNFSSSFTNWEKHPTRKRLKKITFDEGEVNFIYDHGRHDYVKEKALTEIIVKNFLGDTISRYKFNYTYMISKELCSEPECKRLTLISLERTDGSGKTEKHEFEYDTANKLPKRGSLQQDYFGFYNNNGMVGNSSAVNTYTPQLYFYENLGINSVLPFPLSNNTNFTYISGQINLQPNSYSLSGLLKKITYPTGGCSEFTYETNKFQFNGAEYIGGGARILSQKLSEMGATVKQMAYEYKEADGSSSGYINNIPVYAHLSNFELSPFVPKRFYVYDKPKSGLELTSGSFIGYSRVKESEAGNGHSLYEFTSPKDYANIPEQRIAQNILYESTAVNSYNCLCKFIENNAYPGKVFIDNNHKQGKLLSKSIYNDAGAILEKEQKDYVPRSFSSIQLADNMKIYGSYEVDSGGEFPEHVLRIVSSIPVAQFLNTVTDKTSYLESGTLATSKSYEYHPIYPFIKKERFYLNGFSTTVERSYPTDVSNLNYMGMLIQTNRISEQVKSTVWRNYDLISTSIANYDGFNNNIYLPKSLSTSKGDLALEEGAVIDLRDDKGNITQYHTEANVYHTIIWGYNKTHPVIKIENASYYSIQSTLISSVQSASNINDESQLLSSLGALRNSLPAGSLATSYTYKPLVGVSTVKDPKGDFTRYEYDTFGRLKSVRDKNNNIVSESEYHFRLQN